MVTDLYPNLLVACDRVEATQPLPGDNTPMQGSGAGGPRLLPTANTFGPSEGDPVNLTNGQEEYKPPADITVYNPIGPSVVWGHMYNSQSNWDSAFGLGWSHPYNFAVLPPNGGTHGAIVYPNNAREPFTGSVPTSMSPDTTCSFDASGVGVDLHWKYDAGGNYFVATFKDHSSFETVKTSSDAYLRPAKLSDKRGNYIKFNYSNYTPGTGYSQRPRLTSITDSANSALLTMTLDGNGNIQEAAGRNSRSVYYTVSSHAYTPHGGASLSPAFSFELDASSVIVTHGTGSPTARYTYGYSDYNNNASDQHQVPYLSSITVQDPDGSGTIANALTYDTNGRVATISDANIASNMGCKTAFTYGSGNTTVDLQDYNTASIYRYIASYSGSRITQYDVVDTGNYNTANTVVHYTYADSDCPRKPDTVQQFYDAAPVPLSRTWAMDYDAHGNLLSRTAPSGLTTTYSYSTPGGWPLGELDWVQESNGGSALLKTWFFYNGTYEINQIDTAVPGQAAGSSTQSTYITYTSLGNVSTVTTPGNNDTSTHITTYGYTSDSWGGYSGSEALGQPVTVTDTLNHVTHLRYDSDGNLTNVADPLLNETVYSYNIANQRTGVTLPDQTGSAGNATQTVVYLYDGGPATQVKAYDTASTLVRTVNFTYGHEGELLSRTGDCEEVAYTYDPLYRVKTLEDGATNATTYKYNLFGDMTEVDMPGWTSGNPDRTLFTSFDLQGNCLSRTDGNGVVTDYEYGTSSADDGLLTEIDYPGSSQTVTIDRDVFNRVDQVTDFAGDETYDYDYLGNVTSKTTTYTGVTAQTFDYTFYPDGSRETMVNSAGTWTYYYDSDGRCRELSSPANVSSNHYVSTFFDNDAQDRRTLPNGAYTDTTWDNLGLPASRVNKNGAGTTLSDYNTFLWHDGVFNMKKMTVGTQAAGYTEWEYDNQDRLTREHSTRGIAYNQYFRYDGAGNPTLWKGASSGASNNQTFNADNQRTSGGSYVYDGNGNPTTYAGTAFTYDPEDRVSGVGASVGMDWRADGLRATETVSGTKTAFFYDRGNPVLETSTGGTVNAIGVFAPDGLVARKVGSTWTYYEFDPQGSTAHRLDSSGALVNGLYYDAYGQYRVAPTGSNVDVYNYNGRWGYYNDLNTGLTLCQHRFYDVARGRWVNRDPIGYAGGANLYGYCGSGPVGRGDPEGLDYWNIWDWDGQVWYQFGSDLGSGTVLGLQTSGHALMSVAIDNSLLLSLMDGGRWDAEHGGEEGYFVSKLCWILAADAAFGAAGEGMGGAGSCIKPGPMPGVYLHLTEDGFWYAGQSGNLYGRTKTWAFLRDLDCCQLFEMPGSTKLEREIAEQGLLDGLRADGLPVLNKRNPIGAARSKFMK